MFTIMIEELDRANSIITEFLSLAKNKVLTLKLTNLNTIIHALFPLIQANAVAADKLVKLELTKLNDIMLDEKEIRQLILNLVHNGLEAMKPKGILTIKTYMESSHIVLAVQDQGRGINPEIIEKLGTPFVTTKENGTGLGVAICYGITDRHHATIDVQTSSKGTTFYIRFKTK